LFDLDSVIVCQDGQVDFLLAFGTCDAPTSAFDSFLALDGVPLPATFCVRRVDAPASSGLELQVLDFTLDEIHLKSTAPRPLVTSAFAGGLPARTALGGLTAGAHYRLSLTITDGNTVPVIATSDFLYQGEQWLVFNGPPTAVLSGGGSVECLGGAGAVTLDGSASSDPDSTPGTHDDIAAYDWYEDFGAASERRLGSGPTLAVTLPLGPHAITLRVTDRDGAASTATQVVSVLDTQPPTVACPTALPAVECEGAGGAYVGVVATALDTCAGTLPLSNDRTAGGGDASAPYPLGTTSVTFTATDTAGLRATCASQVTVRDTLPPTLTVYTDPVVLWPPNHELVPVHPRLVAQDRCDPSVRATFVSVTSSEPDDATGNGDGATVGDIQDADPGAGGTDLLLRAERDGKGPGRVYTLSYQAIDASGNRAPGLATVTVPHDQGNGPEPLLMRLAPAAADSSAMTIFWPAVSEAVGYNVISGDLSAMHVEGGILRLGTVRVLARGTMETSVSEASPGAAPAVGQGFFYLIEQVTTAGAVGYGTETGPWPRIPDACDGGCPGAEIPGSADGGGTGSGGTARR
jgi:hypothetical protein